MRYWGRVAFWCAIATLALLLVWSFSGPATVYSQIGWIQILEREEGIWLFYEIETISRWPVGDPVSEVTGQGLVIIDQNGVRSHERANGSLATLHPNLALIVATKNEFFRCGFTPPKTLGTIYRWGDSGFEKVSFDQMVALLDEENLTWGSDIVTEANRITEESGWQAFDRWHARFDAFRQNEHRSASKQIRIGIEQRQRTHALVAESLNRSDWWSESLLEVNLRRHWRWR